jgi:hypothetical protein
MHAWIPSLPAVAELALMAGLMFGIGSWRSARALDRAYDDGYDRAKAKWYDLGYDDGFDDSPGIRAAAGRDPARSLAELAVRDMQISRSERDGSPEDGPGSPASGGETAITPGPGSEPSGATGPALAPNWRDQIRQELSPLADVPRPDRVIGGREPPGPGHPAPDWYAGGLHWLANWRAEWQHEAARADEEIAAWIAESELALAGASWQDRLR